jgi:uncharacterized membrane protein
MAIYGAMLLFGILFAVTGRKWKPLPIWLWFLFGIFPIGFDGVSQLIGQWISLGAFDFLESALGWWPIRESTPLLRTLTGFLFGFTTAWFGFPLIEEAMADTRRLMKTKKEIVESSHPTQP